MVLAGLAAVYEVDMRRVVAMSTLRQLGLMFFLLSAHVEAPLPGSMVLAAVLLKLGSYGWLWECYFLHSIPPLTHSAFSDIGDGIIITISKSKIRNRIAVRKYWLENGGVVELHLVKPHSNGDDDWF
ncbi:hypothetical protein B4U79_01514, partial [Dinothrombium tinctorium]